MENEQKARQEKYAHIPQRLMENEKLIIYRDEMADIFSPYTGDLENREEHDAFLKDKMEKMRKQLMKLKED